MKRFVLKLGELQDSDVAEVVLDSLIQIIASGSAVYAIPWPPGFLSFISALRIFLVDVISITKANCAQPMTYYASLTIVLVGLKIALVLLLVGPLLFERLLRSGIGLFRRVRHRDVQVRLSLRQLALRKRTLYA